MAANGSTPPPAQIEEGGEHDPVGTSDHLALPFARIKKLMKEQDEVKQVGADAVFTMGKATELLLQELTQRAARNVDDSVRKTVQYRDVATAVRSMEPLEFLHEVVPDKVYYGQVKRQQEEQQEERQRRRQQQQQQQQHHQVQQQD